MTAPHRCFPAVALASAIEDPQQNQAEQGRNDRSHLKTPLRLGRNWWVEIWISISRRLRPDVRNAWLSKAPPHLDAVASSLESPKRHPVYSK
jgi:hypothetical protein